MVRWLLLAFVTLLAAPVGAQAPSRPPALDAEPEAPRALRGLRAPRELPPLDHLWLSLGAGASVRLLVHADVCDADAPGSEGCRFGPAYLQLRGGWLFASGGPVQHGLSLGLATNISLEGPALQDHVAELGQWVLSPAYVLRGWLGPWVQVMGIVGLPIAITSVQLDGGRASDVETNWGIELEGRAIVKVLAGLGLYAAVNLGTFFSLAGSAWPAVAFEGGIVLDYEVLP